MTAPLRLTPWRYLRPLVLLPALGLGLPGHLAARPLPPAQQVKHPAADVTITGTVLDEKGTGMPGTTVVLKGTSLGTTTDAEGRFPLRIPDGTAAPTLVISSIGYVKQEIVVGSRTTFTVNLAPNAQDMNEVVVVGYGTQRRADVTGSVASVPQDRLERLPVSNVAQAIQGAVAGVTVTSGSSVPGAQSSIQIRGGARLRPAPTPTLFWTACRCFRAT